MFTLEQPENPLAVLLANAGSAAFQQQARQSEAKRRASKIQGSLSKLNENSTPLDWLNATGDLPEEDREGLLKVYDQISKSKRGESELELEKEKISNSKRAKEEEAERAGRLLWNEALSHNVDPSTIPEGTPYEQGSKYINAIRKQTGDQSPELVFKEMTSLGMPKNLAAAYARGGQGERTEILKQFLDLQKRGLTAETSEAPVQQKTSSRDKGLTPSELVKRQEKRFEKQTPLVAADREKLNTYEQDAQRIDRLQQLNDTDELPSGFWQRMNVDWENGKIRVPALATPEAQLFVKTVQEFLSSAKDTFGSRVTNFDVSQFMQRLPTLANTKEGRELILKQMTSINRLNQLEKQSILDVYDEYGGVRNIDHSDAERIAQGRIKKEKEDIKQEFRDLNGYFRRSDKDRLEWAKQKAPKGQVLMENAEGELGYVPKDKVKEKESQGYKRR